jgi:hypothetical protein
LDVLDTALEVIDLRSFSNLWYWIALAALWSSVSHWVLGVPHDMIQRARREGGQAQADVEDLVGSTSTGFCTWLIPGRCSGRDGRVLVVRPTGPGLLVRRGICAGCGVAVRADDAGGLGFSVRVSRKIVAEAATGEALFRRLTIHRRVVQVIGMLAITVTAFYGTWQNISVSILN